jgi:pyrroloquinoline quinone (PQQ) biosynthesis protein C
MDLIERLDEVGRRWNVLEHPFYRRWEAGALTTEELRFYAGEYRHAVVALADAAAVAGDAEHACEEAAHVALWDQFAGSLEAPLDRPPRDETARCADGWRRNERLEAQAVLYAVESVQPAISKTKLDGLVEHYGFDREAPATDYFRLHATRDVEHSAAVKAELLATASVDDTDRLVAAAERALRGNWELLDGVEAEFTSAT